MELIRCKDCKWWKLIGSGSVGMCRAFPPKIIPDAISHNDERRWPLSFSDEYCGKAEPKDGAK